MKWKTSMKYQITESIKPLAIFYGILYGLVGITLVISRAVADVGGFSGMESSTMVFLLFCGVFSFVEDFRFFLQNGMTRRMIFQRECAQFSLISLFMMLVGTGMGALLHWLAAYESMFHLIYGHS